MNLENTGLVLEIIGAAIIWWAAHYRQFWVAKFDENDKVVLDRKGREVWDKEASPGIKWTRFMRLGLLFLIAGFISQLAENLRFEVAR